MSRGVGVDADEVRCAIVGAGPAGLMLGLLLARAGIAVTVLEKHADFLICDRHLAAVEAHRRFPTKATQKLRLMMRRDRRKHEGARRKRSRPPAFMRYIARWPILSRLAGRLIGLGFRPGHVRLPPAEAWERSAAAR